MKAAPKKRDPRHEFFPPDGLVQQYKPFIIKEARRCSQRYYLRLWDVLPEAVRLAELAEKKFDPKRGTTFGTLLRWELKRLNRWGAREYRRNRGLIRAPDPKPEAWEVPDKKARRLAYERERDVGWFGAVKKQEYEDHIYGESLPRVGPTNYSAWKKKKARSPRGFARLASAAERLRPGMRNDKQRAVLDWMVGDLLGRETRTMMQAAADIGVARGYASKIVSKIAGHIR